MLKAQVHMNVGERQQLAQIRLIMDADIDGF
jgi:hypothetical protein